MASRTPGLSSKDCRSYCRLSYLETESQIHCQEQLLAKHKTEVPQRAGRCESIVLIRVAFQDGFNTLVEMVPLLL